MSNIACATLVLRAFDISTASSIGFTNTTRTEMTWNNINLRTLLGDMYDKFDTFNICLNSIACGPPPADLGGTYGDSDIDNLQHLINISGLPFINQTYSQPSNCNTSSAIVGVFLYPSATANVGYRVYNDSGVLTFGKNQEQCNISIRHTRVYDNLEPDTTLAFPTTTYIFSIVGVDKKSDTNGSRI
jgi:hypothetical protein